MKSMHLKCDSGSIEIHVLSYENENPEDISDADWLNCSIDLNIFPFYGNFKIPLCIADFRDLLNQISRIRNGSAREANFVTYEGLFDFNMNITKTGKLEISGRISMQSVTLTFKSQSDQSYLQEMEQELVAIVQAFPIKSL